MPWWNYRPRYYYRRYRRRWRRPRPPIFRRFYRRKWVRRRRFKRKLRKIKIKQYQPQSIRKCKIKGPICLFQTTNTRIDRNFDSYELSEVPEHLPGGGGWGIKVYSLEGLYAEHAYARNLWTVSNNNLPLVRYTGCHIKLFQSEYVDYIVTYTNQTPMVSTLAMYNTMQPSIHNLMQHRIVVPSIKTYKRKKPWIKKFIPPPTQLENKWYFQQDICKQPLLMIRVSATSVNKYFIDPDKINTNININTLNVTVFQNREFYLTGPKIYWAKIIREKKYYLYASYESGKPNTLKKSQLVPLTDTMNFTLGSTFNHIYHSDTITEAWKTGYTNNVGNPFYPDYLQGTYRIVLIDQDPQTLFNNITQQNVTTFVDDIELIKTLRYNTYADQGSNNMAYFKSNSKDEVGWLPPDNPELTNEDLPFWLLLWGFPDWHKRIKKHLHLETSYILTLRHKPATGWEYLVPLSDSFINGKSPYEGGEGPNPTDAKTWHPQLQYQNEIINMICRAGPGTAKIPDNFSVQGLMRYTFYFKWGGSPPPMSTITDPKDQPTFVIPGNKYATNSLQNPTTAPENLLWSFDQRRDYLTPRAIKRLQSDKTTKETFITGPSHFSETPQTSTQDPQETSSEEEEEETLYQQLFKQRLKQQRLKQRILATIQQIQNIE